MKQKINKVFCSMQTFDKSIKKFFTRAATYFRRTITFFKRLTTFFKRLITFFKRLITFFRRLITFFRRKLNFLKSNPTIYRILAEAVCEFIKDKSPCCKDHFTNTTVPFTACRGLWSKEYSAIQTYTPELASAPFSLPFHFLKGSVLVNTG